MHVPLLLASFTHTHVCSLNRATRHGDLIYRPFLWRWLSKPLYTITCIPAIVKALQWLQLVSYHHPIIIHRRPLLDDPPDPQAASTIHHHRMEGVLHDVGVYDAS